MRPSLLVTRPAEDYARTARAAGEAGFDTLDAPLMRIESLDWQLPAGDFDSLLFTSPQGPKHALPHRARLEGLPVYAVGRATAEAAAAHGFPVAAIGDRDASAIVAQAAAFGCRHMLHLSGQDVAALSAPPALRISRVPVYRAILAEALPAHAQQALAAGSVFATLLYSPRTAKRFGALVDAAALDRGSLRIISISHAAAAAAGPGWSASTSAETPATDALLVAARTLWQSSAHG